MDILEEGRKVFDIEIEALIKTRDSLDKTFTDILKVIIACKGKIVVTGIGKPGHIAAKLAATFSSLGTPSFHLHPAEAMHGDLGMISGDDVVIAISYSGESDEIINIIPNIKLIGATLIGITGNVDSTLARLSDYVQIFPKFEEACCLGLAPTSSTTAALCYGDALAVTASSIYGFKEADFGKFHPAGSLGKKIIMKVENLMASGSDNAVISVDSTLKDAVVELSKKGLGIVSVVDVNNKLLGIITDGDLRRQLEKGVDVYNLAVRDAMTKKPVIISKNKLAVEALNLMKERNISCLPVVESGAAIGAIRLQMILSAGIVG